VQYLIDCARRLEVEGAGWAPLLTHNKEEKKESQRFWELVGSHQQPQLCLDERKPKVQVQW